MRGTTLLSALAVAASLLGAPAAAQSDILLQARGGSPPGERFRVDSTGGVVAYGKLGRGVIPASGSGNRMMWYPFKVSFRAGTSVGTNWDDISNGYYSWAGGYGTISAGSYSFAMGNGGIANGGSAVALGETVIANHNYTIALG